MKNLYIRLHKVNYSLCGDAGGGATRGRERREYEDRSFIILPALSWPASSITIIGKKRGRRKESGRLQVTKAVIICFPKTPIRLA